MASLCSKTLTFLRGRMLRRCSRRPGLSCWWLRHASQLREQRRTWTELRCVQRCRSPRWATRQG